MGYLVGKHSYTPALGYMEMVTCLDAMILLPIIKQHLHPGIVIRSDEWAAFKHVQLLPSVSHHSTINHSVTFICLATGLHTWNIKSYWNCVKTNFKRGNYTD